MLRFKEGDIVWLENESQIGVVEKIMTWSYEQIEITLRIPKKSNHDGLNDNHVRFRVYPIDVKILSTEETMDKVYELFEKSLKHLLNALHEGNKEALRTYKL